MSEEMKLPPLEKPCPYADYEADIDRWICRLTRCEECHGNDVVPTEAGEQVLELMRHHIGAMLKARLS